MKFKTDFPPDDNSVTGDNVAKNKQSTPHIGEIYNPFQKLDKEFLSFQTQKIENNTDVDKEREYTEEDKNTLASIVELAKNSKENFDIKDIENLNFKKANLDKFLLAGFILSKGKDSLSEKQIKAYETILKDREQMRKIYYDNYSDNEELRDELLKDFDKIVGTPGENYKYEGLPSSLIDLNILKYKDKVISFNILQYMPYGHKSSFKSFNVNNDVKGIGLGTLMTKVTLDKRAQNNEIVASCSSSKPITSFYIENGFIARDYFNYKNENGLSIIRADKIIPDEFITKKMTKEEILRGENLPQGTIVKSYLKQEDCDFTPIKKKYDQSAYPFKLEIPQEYVLTRYFYDEKSQKWIVVLEKTKRDLRDFL